ncbi:methyltransferase domain-containing protein [Myxococcota bacterium]|nr:methyltransferase domain-containing protein [Myxococcota bacterium]
MHPVFFELHSGLPREAPGSDASTLRALAMCGDLGPRPRILDVGCGPGAQTLTLARATGGHVTAVDLHRPYLDEVTRRAEAAGLRAHVTTLERSMVELDPALEADLVWAEGSLYSVGFEHALTTLARHVALRGALAATELTWLVDHPSDAARDFWRTGYPEMESLSGNIARATRAGWRVIGTFTLPDDDWWTPYYGPLSARLAALRATYSTDRDALAALDAEAAEIELYRDHAAEYGYVFYVLRRP